METKIKRTPAEMLEAFLADKGVNGDLYPPIDPVKWEALMKEKWPQIMRENAMIGLPVYER